MENASKALIMAAGTLIGILVISLATYLFADFGATSAKINKQVEEQRIVQFNSQFTSYIDKDLTIYDIITILGYAQENNEYYQDVTNEQIEVFIGTREITSYNSQQKQGLINDELNNVDTVLTKYILKAQAVEYKNNDGKVSKITFREK